MRRALTIAALVMATTGTAAAQAVSKDGGAWKTLSLDTWRGYKSDTLPSGWKQLDPTTFEKSGHSDDIVSKGNYTNFELELDWRVTKGGNAGIFYRATEEGEKVYHTGPEYQLLDNPNHPDGKNPLTSAGAAYGLYAPPPNVVKPAGEWNSTRIVVQGAHVQHWLNGTKTADYTLWSPDWEAKVKASKFAAWPGYGRAKSGHVALQGDHTGTLTIRNARIRELK